MAEAVDDQRAKVMVDQTAFRVRLDAATPRHFFDLVGRPGQKAPMARIVLVTLRVGLQDLRRVKHRIESDGDEVPISETAAAGAEDSGGFLEIFGQLRAEVRHGAAREKKCYAQSLPGKIREADRLPQFIGEFIIEKGVSLSRGRLSGRRRESGRIRRALPK